MDEPKQMPFHPLADGYPLLEGVPFEELADSIEKGGLEVPIVVWRGQILDGRNRYHACLARGVEPRFDDRSGMKEEDLPELLEALNEHRRHLTPEDQARRRHERIARVAGKRRAGMSLREIAEEEGVSNPQVLADLREATAKGLAVGPEGGKVTGKDGKSRPASRTPSPNAGANGKAPAAAEGPAHPHSDRLFRWTTYVVCELHAMEAERGGISGMLAEPEGWDWGKVSRAILPVLEELETAVARMRKEVARHAADRGTP